MEFNFQKFKNILQHHLDYKKKSKRNLIKRKGEIIEKTKTIQKLHTNITIIKILITKYLLNDIELFPKKKLKQLSATIFVFFMILSPISLCLTEKSNEVIINYNKTYLNIYIKTSIFRNSNKNISKSSIKSNQENPKNRTFIHPFPLSNRSKSKFPNQFFFVKVLPFVLLKKKFFFSLPSIKYVFFVLELSRNKK